MFIPREKLLKSSLRIAGVDGDLSFGHDAVVRKLQQLNGQVVDGAASAAPLFSVTDYDEDYKGIQLVLSNKSIKFERIPYTVFPMVYGNKLLEMDFRHPFPRISAIQQFAEPLEITAVQVGSTVLPMAVDSKSVLKKPDDYESDVMDLVWFIMSGQAGRLPAEILSFVKDNIEFTDESVEANGSFTAYASQLYSDEHLVEYHSELRPTRVGLDNGVVVLHVGSNDEKNDVKEIRIPSSSDKISDDTLIVDYFGRSEVISKILKM